MSATGFSYQRLRNDEIDIEIEIDQSKARIVRWPKRLHMRKRLKMKIPRLMKRFVRRKARVIMASVAKVLKRLKESQSHFGDLFAGNYLFLQVTPTPLKSSSHAVVARESMRRIEGGYC